MQGFRSFHSAWRTIQGIERDCNGNCVNGWSHLDQSESIKWGLSRSPKIVIS
jgi:hypothetical protein